MIIYDIEKEDGVADKVIASRSVSYASVAEPCSLTSNTSKYFKSLASYDDNDLYYVQSILVSSNWNKNDDVFDKYEVWNAKNTPEHKPTNLEHNENLIVGHIISNWPITTEGVLIDTDTPIENLPEKFHILTGSVIYKAFSNPELRERSEKLISEIQSGTKYVSMECLFKGFDYGIINKQNNEYKILSRNNDTAYLTKYLKAYGGKGENNDYKIGRVLRNITFTGKGFVDKPANEESIIFNKSLFSENNNQQIAEKNNEFLNLGVINIRPNDNMENNTMSVEQDVTEIKNKLVAMETSCQEAVAEANASVDSLKEKNVALENQLQTQTNEFTERETAMKKEIEEVKASASEELETLKSSLEAKIAELSEAIAAKDTEMKKKDEEMQKMKAELDSATETVAAYKTKEEEMMKKDKMMKRKASLVDNGVEEDAALAFVEKFLSLEDEAFDAMATLFAAVKMKKEEATKMKMKASEEESEDESEAMKMTEDKKEEKAAKTTKVSSSVLDSVETEDSIDITVGSDSSDEEDTTRAALVQFVYSKLGKKSK
jgi:hypothetical protein